MTAAAKAGEAAFRHQEIAFSVVMAALAVLLRDTPGYSPNLLWAFAALLAFNLAYHMLLRRKGETWFVPMISMAVNTVLITGVLFLSGTEDSPFWPLYLVPIFTACLYLERRHVAFATVSSAAFLASLCLYSDEPGEPWRWTFAEYAIKFAVLTVSAAVTAQYAFRERRAHADLSATRAELELLSSELERAERDRLEAAGGMARFMAGLIYDLNARLALIRGRAELLTETLGADTPQAEDARSIAASARALGRLGSDLLRVLKRGEEDSAPCSVAPLLDQVLNLIEHGLVPKKLRLERTLPDGLPEVPIGMPHLQQVLLELLETAAENARPGSVLRAEAQALPDEVQLRLGFDAPDDRTPPSPVSQRRLLEGFGASVEALGMGRSCEYVVRLPLGAGARRPG